MPTAGGQVQIHFSKSAHRTRRPALHLASGIKDDGQMMKVVFIFMWLCMVWLIT
jgi:hypothetical protein